jgi:hypothetical protein
MIKIIDELKSILKVISMASLNHCLGIWLKGLTNTMGHFSQGLWCPDKGLNEHLPSTVLE